LFEGNDFADLINEAQSPLLMRYLERDFSQGLRYHQSEIDAALELHWVGALEEARTRWPEEAAPGIPGVIRFQGWRSSLRQLRRSDNRQQEQKRSIGLLADVIAEAKMTADSWGGRIYLVYLPERQRFANSRAASQSENKRRVVMEVASSLGVEFIDIPAAFRSSGDPLELFPFRRRGHYNDAGHRVVGETVLRKISSEVADDRSADGGADPAIIAKAR
jgi:hypothetical protein